MNREKLKAHRRNVREREKLEEQIGDLEERYENIPVVMGTVTGSSKEYPYTESHVKVLMHEPRKAQEISSAIMKKRKTIARIDMEIKEVEEYIDSLPDGYEKRIMEMVYLEGMSQSDVARLVGYTQGRISQIVKRCTKD